VAFDELLSDKFTFTENKMQEHYSQPIEVDYDGMKLLQVENFLLHKKCYRTFSFLHRTVQEFATAWYLIFLNSDEQSMIFTAMLQSNFINFEMMVAW